MNNNILLTSFTLDELKIVISEVMQTEIQKVNAIAAPEQTQFITRNETIAILGISLPTLNNWTKSGLVQGYRIGSRVRYKKSEVLESLAEIHSAKVKNPISK